MDLFLIPGVFNVVNLEERRWGPDSHIELNTIEDKREQYFIVL